MSNLTKEDLVEAIYRQLNVQSKQSALELMDAVMELIKERLERGEAVKLPKFGNFTVRSKSSRIGRNPKTGEEIEITPRKVLLFKASPTLRNRVNNGAGRTVADISSQHIAITGTLDTITRDEAIQHILKAGGHFTKTVTQATTVLVVGADPGQRKIEKARRNRVKKIDEVRFLELVGVAHTPRLPGL